MQIGELAKRSGLSASRIRFYEAQGLISVSRRANGYRAYSAEALVALNIITSAQEAGFTLEEIRRLMPGDLSHCRDGALLGALRKKVDDIGAMEKRLVQTRLQIEALIAVIEDRPEGMSHEANADRVLKQFRGVQRTQIDDSIISHDGHNILNQWVD
ncbi:MerR family transcriptional regulator [Phenylobacterium sp.]|uniref:MerR family transcriptional regulator n=1 Tax=Phenylobacterium sp. TaxID=1871053 RepID=UPI002E35132F|nr:MerR family transcriptional regulator [Phenylobacterium sp.]HEX4711361.1 MerR family transcriptional regulator [Phenylobacterium sp.]